MNACSHPKLSQPALPMLACTLALLAGCRSTPPQPAPQHAPRTVDRTAIQSALDRFAADSPSCLWADPVSMPYRARPALPLRVAGFQALARAGLLTQTRKGADTLFSLTPAGREQWTPSQQKAASGNFCYGVRKVAGIESITATDDENFGPAQEISYRAGYTDVPDWAQTAEVERAFPLIQLEMTRTLPHSATAVWRDGAWKIVAGPAGSIAEPAVPTPRLSEVPHPPQ